MTSSITAHQALVYAMVIAAMADGKLKESEVAIINEFSMALPVFKDFEPFALRQAIADCEELLTGANGLDTAISQMRAALPERLCETAYAIACDVVAVDGSAPQEELRWLEMIRHGLNISRLHAAAIERGSKARYTKFQS